jgi:hypothetical protein
MSGPEFRHEVDLPYGLQLVSRLIKVLLTTLGNPTNPTLAIPVLATSKPAPGPPPPPLGGAISSRRSLASLAGGKGT